MNGQWLGSYKDGDIEVDLILNIDAVEDHYEGEAYINPRSMDIPWAMAYFVTEDKNTEQTFESFIHPINPMDGALCEWETIKNQYADNILFSTKANVTLKKIDDKLYTNVLSEHGMVIESILTKSSESDTSKIVSKEMSWDEFKLELSEMLNLNYLFRGQKKPWRLRSAFHRRERYRISEFINKDVKQLHQKLSSLTSHYFNLEVPDKNGAFFNLLQHHGYPTPLLDWSYSPYVAAFFAFRDYPIKYNKDGNVRIYIFDNDSWQKTYSQIKNLDPFFPHLSVMEFISINNPRLVPQQAITTITNIDDIEEYIMKKEKEKEKTFLQAIDIPAKERDKVMNDLWFMGVTAGSMFPSIDGICEELRDCNFDK